MATSEIHPAAESDQLWSEIDRAGACPEEVGSQYQAYYTLWEQARQGLLAPHLSSDVDMRVVNEALANQMSVEFRDKKYVAPMLSVLYRAHGMRGPMMVVELHRYTTYLEGYERHTYTYHIGADGKYSARFIQSNKRAWPAAQEGNGEGMLYRDINWLQQAKIELLAKEAASTVQDAAPDRQHARGLLTRLLPRLGLGLLRPDS